MSCRNSFRQSPEQRAERISKILHRRIVALSRHHDQIITLWKVVLQASKRFTNPAAFQIATYGRTMFPRDTQAQTSDFQFIRRCKDQQMIIASPLSICVDANKVLRISQVHGLWTAIVLLLFHGVLALRVICVNDFDCSGSQGFACPVCGSDGKTRACGTTGVFRTDDRTRQNQIQA